MRETITTCDICGDRYRILDRNKEVEKTFTIQDKKYDICMRCESKILKYISEMKGEPVDARRFPFD